ncbi:HAAS signaling domain-containing protein [Methanoregula sp.]|jgi:uncharacterized membrane protein|uniref:HAAS signaling domain-containing protein n=1 Tax=Methanoregula sp. TaxID=2052170 RepID=UPI003C1BC4AF
MQRNEQDYLNTLKDRLTGHVSREDLDDILSDYAEHFSIGKSEGRSEEDLCRALGSPDDVAREIRASYLVKKAEQSCGARNIWSAVVATLGLGLFNLAVVLVPFILLIALLTVIFVAGVVLVILGPLLLLVSIVQMLGITVSTPWASPLAGIVISVGISVAGIFLIVAALGLGKFFYRVGIRYLKWNIRIIRGGEGPDRDGEPCLSTAAIPRDGAQNLELQVRLGAGDLSVREGTGDNNLAEFAAHGTACAHPSVLASADGKGKRVRIRGRHALATSWWSDESSPALEIGITREVPVALDVLNKAGRTTLALGALNLTGLRVRNGAGETYVDLAGYAGPGFDGEIRNGVGHMVIRVPKEYPLRIRVHRGIGDTEVRGLIIEGDTYVTRPERKDAPQITIQIRQGMGSIFLEAI